MKKEIYNSLKINELIANRWSPKSFMNKAIEIEKIHRFLEAARWAPSSYNEQPWRFIVGLQGKGTSYNKIFECLMEANRAWASSTPLLLVAIAKKTYSKTGKKNHSSEYDTGQAVANLTLQASTDGLHLHQMGGFDKNKIIESFNIPHDFSPQTVIAIGYLDTTHAIKNEEQQSAASKRNRKELQELVFQEKSNKETSIF